MASVELGTLFLNDAANPADWVKFVWMSSLRRTPSVSGEVRRMAGGNTRSVTRRGKHQQWEANLPLCTPEQVEWIEDHIGRVVLCRDDRGSKIYAVYYQSPFELHDYDLESDASLSLVEVTWDENE